MPKARSSERAFFYVQDVRYAARAMDGGSGEPNV